MVELSTVDRTRRLVALNSIRFLSLKAAVATIDSIWSRSALKSLLSAV